MRYEAIVYFDGPISRFQQAPWSSEILQSRTFRFRWLAEGWARGRLRGFANVAYIVRPVA